jgi:phosphomannomutase
MTTPTISAAEIEARVYLATLAADLSTRRRVLVDALCEHYPNITGLDPYTDMIVEALASSRTKLKEIREVVGQGHGAAYDLRNDILTILDREELP